MLPSSFLRPGEAASRLGLSYARIHQLLRDGTLPYTSTPLGRLIAIEDVDRLVEERAAKIAQKGAGDASS